MAVKASSETIRISMATYSGCSAYPSELLIGSKKINPAIVNKTDVNPTDISVVLYTCIGFLISFLLINRKKPVSIP